MVLLPTRARRDSLRCGEASLGRFFACQLLISYTLFCCIFFSLFFRVSGKPPIIAVRMRMPRFAVVCPWSVFLAFRASLRVAIISYLLGFTRLEIVDNFTYFPKERARVWLSKCPRACSSHLVLRAHRSPSAKGVWRLKPTLDAKQWFLSIS